MEGEHFGRLTVVRDVVVPNNRHKCVLCRCACGKTVITELRYLLSGRVVSCGCAKVDFLRKYATKHGLCESDIYHRWEDMKSRCYNKNNKAYKNYGGRGIKVCEEWKDTPAAFAEWAKRNGFQPNLSLDRIDVNGGYSPDNCRWATRKEQQANRRNNIYLTYNGETRMITEWARILGVAFQTIRYHLKRGKNFEEIYRMFKND